jgi:hypothetical protein
MALNFNVDPYYDDFDPSKNFYRILFKPGYAVQARELTQSQSILQNQVVQFASSIFAQNTPISGGKVTTNLNCYYIKLQEVYNGTTIDVTQFNGQTIQDATGTILARVVATVPSTGVGADPATLIISYLSGSHFPDGAVVFIQNSNYAGQAIASNSSGKSSVVSISQGVFYVASNYTNINGEMITNGAFVQVNPQTIVLDKYDNSPSLRIGLNIVENIINSSVDSSLLDPAIGASNYQAPGADRYQIQLQLVNLPISLGNDQNFIELVRIVNGTIVYVNNTTQYSSIDDYLAKRTFETNGDFIVNDFSLTPVSNTATPNGHNGYTQYDLKVGKGVAYVHGYRLENQSDLTLTNDRAQSTVTQNNNYNFIDYGQYFYVDTVNGLFDVTTNPKVDLHVVPLGNIVTSNATTYKSTLIGSGHIRGLVYDHAGDGIGANTTSYIYKAYVTDIVANTLTSNAVTATGTTIQFYDINGTFTSTANGYYGVNLAIVSGPSAGDVRQIVSYNGATKTATVNPAFTTTPTSSSVFALQFSPSNVQTVANTSSSNSLAILSSAEINLEGKLGGVSTGATFYENPNAPELIYNLGYPYVSSVSNTQYQSTQVFRNKQFTGTPATLAVTLPSGIQGVVGYAGGTGVISGDTIRQNYTVIVTSAGDTANNGTLGSVLDISSSSSNTTVTIANNTLTIQSTKYKSNTNFAVSIIAKVNVINADNNQHILKTKTLINGNTTSNSAVSGTSVTGNSNVSCDLVNGQVYIKNGGLVTPGLDQSLYVTDLKSIVKIVDSLSPSTNVTTTMLSDSTNDITNNFTLDNGQRDSIYGHASIKLKPGVPAPQGNILVIFNYYSHTAQLADGYFSYESYINSGETYGSIPSYTAKDGVVYNLRDCIDFRPSRLNGTTSSVLEYTGNPGSDDTGTYIPQDLTNFESNYSYYLGRKDRLVLSKDKNFQIVQGNPSLNPILPTQPDGSLLIANLNHDPYTVYIPSEAPAGKLPNLSIDKVRHRRWRMQDISDLEARLDNISLSPIEQTISNIQIPDVNGIPRIKNAIIVDDFTTYAIADTSNPNFIAGIDTLKNTFSAAQVVESYTLQANTAINSLTQLSANTMAQLGYTVHNVGRGSRYYTLPYSNTAIVTQQLASRTININPFAIPTYQGILSLYPPMDNWIDNTIAPDLLVADADTLVKSTNGLNSTNVNNWQTIPGTQNVNANTSTLVSSYALNQGYIKNITSQPYIAPQEIIVRAKSLNVNTPIGCYFDGVNVNQYMTNPDIMELKNGVGQFQEDDVIGIFNKSDNTFYPIAVVAYAYQYPNSSNVRLYVTSNFHTNYQSLTNSDYITNVISNAKFDANGNYLSNTAYAQIINSNAITTKNNGRIIGVGGSFTDITSNNVSGLYNVTMPGYGNFAQSYGIWNTPQPLVNSTFNVSFNVSVTTAQSYYIAAIGDDNIQVYLDGNLLSGYPTSSTQDVSGVMYFNTVSLTAGVHTLKITNGAGDADAFVALAISTKPWTTGQNATTTGTILWSTRTPFQITLPAAISGIADVFTLPGGGSYYTDVTSIALSPLTNAASNLVNSQINITTNYISLGNTNGVLKTGTVGSLSQINFTSNVVSYNAVTGFAVINPPVSVSVGQNSVYGNIDSTYSLIGNQTNYLLAEANGGVSTLSTNENGTFCGIFNVPTGSFTSGSKVFRIDNRSIPTDPTTSTTWAQGTFYASSLSDVNNDSGDFSPSVVSSSQVILSTAVAPTVTVNTSTLTNLLDPIAQTFSIDPKSYPNGAFLSSVKFYFNTKATTTQSPVNLSIVGTENGIPNGSTLDNSIVSLTPNKVNVSNTPSVSVNSTATEFTFSAPVYIQSGVTYAFILQSPSVEYNIWIAAQTDIAVTSTVGTSNSTTTKITSVPYTGQLYETQNSITWTGDATKSLMFVINRCSFNTGSVKIPFVVTQNAPTHKYIGQDVAAYYGSSLINNSKNNITYNDIEMDAFNVTTTDFIATNANVTYTYKAQLQSTGLFDTEKSIVPGRLAAPNYENMILADGQGPRVLQANNSNSFTLFANISTTDNSVTPIISDDGITLFNIQSLINNLPLSNNQITVAYGGGGSVNPYLQSTTTAQVSAPDVAGGVQATANVIITNGQVSSVYFTNPGSGYLNTPVINVVDSNTTPGTGAQIVVSSEFTASGGNALARYITKPITLADTNTSGDLRFYFSAYRPIGTNIYVFYRIQNTNDSQSIVNGQWQLMTFINNSNGYSSNINDLVAFQAAPGTNNTPFNSVSYTSSTTGLTYTTFNQFEFKVVLTTNDNTKVPYLTNLSAVALPSGN